MKLILIVIIFSSETNAKPFCQQYLDSGNSIHDDLNDDSTLLLNKVVRFESAQDFLINLDSNVLATQVRIHTSRSIHRAYPEFPRLIFTDDRDPNQTFIYAFSLRKELPAVLEIQSFNHDKETTSLFKVDWDMDGKPNLIKNPRLCFNCHTGGRPLFSNLSSENIWPFTFEDDLNSAKELEHKLSKLNTRIQLQILRDIVFHSDWLNLLDSAINDSSEIFDKKYFNYKNKLSSTEITNYYLNQRHIFLTSVGYNHRIGQLPLNEQEKRNLRILKVFHVANLANFVDLLSINVRPGNYELSSTAVEGLKKWIDEVQLSNTKKSKWPFYYFFKDSMIRKSSF